MSKIKDERLRTQHNELQAKAFRLLYLLLLISMIVRSIGNFDSQGVKIDVLILIIVSLFMVFNQYRNRLDYSSVIDRGSWPIKILVSIGVGILVLLLDLIENGFTSSVIEYVEIFFGGVVTMMLVQIVISVIRTVISRKVESEYED